MGWDSGRLVLPRKCREIKGTKAVSCTIQTYSVPYTSSIVALILPSTVLYTHMIDGCICIWTLESIGPPALENGMEWEPFIKAVQPRCVELILQSPASPFRTRAPWLVMWSFGRGTGTEMVECSKIPNS